MSVKGFRYGGQIHKYLYDALEGAPESASGVFWATYNTTTESEITAAVADGKAVLCKISDEVFYLTTKLAVGPSGSAWLFASVDQTSVRVTFVSGSYWNSVSTRTIPSKTSDLTNDSGFVNASGASSVFLAHYGSTTADAIYEASADGKVCILTYMFPGTIYYLTWLGQEAVLGPEGTAFEKAAVFTALNGDEKTETEVVGSHWSSFSTVKYARSASPTFTGTPKAPTAASGTNTTQLATTAFVQRETGGKQDKNLGAANAGKFLVVGSDGNITAVTMTAWQGGSF